MRRYSSAQDVLRNVFGYEDFRGHQRAVIECVLKGQDALVIMPTGGGKSLCYQIPALLLPGVTVVISPLISLMQDQVQKLRSLGVRAAYCHSQMSPQALRELYQTMDSGELDLLYLSPERLLQPDMLERMDRLTIGLFAIDEAHCVTVWGEDFRPEYQQLSILKERYPGVARLACTATASPAMREEIASILLTSPLSFVASFKRPNLFYRVFHKRSFYTVIECLERHAGQNGIIYCHKRSSAEALTALLAREGFNVAVYHAGLEYEAREALLNRFQNEPDLVIVATIAFGMGIDKGSIRFVMLFDMPRSPEMYMQQLGRAGRDGLPAEIILFVSRADYVQQMAVLQKEAIASPELFQKQKQRLESMMSIAMTDHCHEASLLAYFGEHTEDCGHCDHCCDGPDSVDVTYEAQKLVLCLFQSFQQLNRSICAHTLLDVLTGRVPSVSADQALTSNSLFGVGQEWSYAKWSALLSILLANGVLKMTTGSQPLLQLDMSAKKLIDNELTIRMAWDERDEGGIKDDQPYPEVTHFELSPSEWKIVDGIEDWSTQTASLYRGTRLHPTALYQIARFKPRRVFELGRLKGVGPKRVEAFGRVLRDYLLTLY